MGHKHRRVNYLSNRNLLVEIAKSKNSYCSFIEDHHRHYDCIIHVEPEELDDKGNVTKPAQSPVEALSALNHDLWEKPHLERLQAAQEASEALGDDPRFATSHIMPIVRVMTFDHIPRNADRIRKSREKNTTHEKVSFQPFQHFELSDGPSWTLVGKSHWEGGMENGHFNAEHGRITDELGKMVFLLAERFASKGSWRGYSYRDDMVSDALENLMENALKFDESRTANPFAFYTQCVTNRFRKVWREEQKHQALRDDLLISMGQAPSMTRQVNDELKKHEPPVVKRKPGRPKRAS